VKSTGRQGEGLVLEWSYLQLEYSLDGVFGASTGDEHPACQLGKARLDQIDKLGGRGHHDGRFVCVE